MLHEITGFDLLLDTTNPETPKFISPVTGDGQRASYTDVLLVLLIERMDKLIAAQPNQDGQIADFVYKPEEAPQVERTVKKEVSHPEAAQTDDEGKPDPDGDNKPESQSRRSNRKKQPTETE